MSWDDFHDFRFQYDARRRLVDAIELNKTGIQKCLHLILEGNPGTGKTTLARIIARIYREEGILDRGHIVEADRASLVAEHVGGTAQKTGELCKRAMGGVLFIDEAYALKLNDEDTFGQEAIDALIGCMEDFKDDLCVIMADYPEEMQRFLNINVRLKNRVSNRIVLSDYSSIEMFQLYELFKQKKGLKASALFEEHLRKILISLCANRDKHFGNAREVRRIMYRVISKFTSRCDREELDFNTAELTPQDIPDEFLKLND